MGVVATLSVAGLNKNFGPFEVLKGVNAYADRGHVVNHRLQWLGKEHLSAL